MCTKSCTPKVEAALRAVAGVEDVVVSLKEKSAVVRGVGLDAQKLVEAVGATGKVRVYCDVSWRCTHEDACMARRHRGAFDDEGVCCVAGGLCDVGGQQQRCEHDRGRW